MKRAKIISITILFFMIGCLSSAAQNKTGKIKGVLTDENGARIVNATITVKGGKFSRKFSPSYDGEFQIDVPEGKYKITVEAHAFVPFKRSKIRVAAGQTENLEIRMQVQSMYDTARTGQN